MNFITNLYERLFEVSPNNDDSEMEGVFVYVEFKFKSGEKYKFLDIWAHNKEQEKDAVFQVIMKLYSHCIKYSKAHIYHYNSYEVNALRRLSQKYNTCENELDELLRAERFIDLYTIY